MDPVGTLDLAGVTDALIAALRTAIGASPLWKVNGGPIKEFVIEVTGQAPDVARDIGGCQLSLALIHVAHDAANRNRSIRGPTGITVPTQPMALTLTYALAAFSGKNYVEEQQAMSVALAWIAAHPIQHFTAVAVPAHAIECTLTIESASLDEIARLWQSFTGAMRLTALLRVGVVFLGADPAPVQPVDPPDRMGLSVAPTGALDVSPQLLGISGPVVIATGKAIGTPLVPGATAIIAGLGLKESDRLFLSPPDDGPIDVTAWATFQPPYMLHLTLPAGPPGAPPISSPQPGIYRLRVGTKTGPWIPLEIKEP
jgi:Pvc16 N-terminal domain